MNNVRLFNMIKDKVGNIHTDEEAIYGADGNPTLRNYLMWRMPGNLWSTSILWKGQKVKSLARRLKKWQLNR